jgi:hypothetical protein
MVIVGPALSYSIGGQFLNIHTDFLRLGVGYYWIMVIVGPALGYSIGGQLLNIHTDFLRLVVGYY